MCPFWVLLNSINIRFIIFDCYVKRELRSFHVSGAIEVFKKFFVPSFYLFHLIKFHEVPIERDLWDSSRASLKGEIDFNQFDFFLMTYHAIVLAMETSMIVSGECL